MVEEKQDKYVRGCSAGAYANISSVLSAPTENLPVPLPIPATTNKGRTVDIFQREISRGYAMSAESYITPPVYGISQS